MVNKINNYGNQLLSLNDKIRAIESGGLEHANDLRDTRDQILGGETTAKEGLESAQKQINELLK